MADIEKALKYITAAEQSLAEAKKILSPGPEPKPKLNKDIQVKEIEKKTGRFIGVAPYFFISIANQAHPSIPGKTPEYSFDDRRHIADRITIENGGHGNFLRFLCDFGYYEPHTTSILGDFFLRNENGKFLTWPPTVDPRWMEVFKFTIDLFVQRMWVVELNFLNHSTLHNRPDSHWFFHPANPINNTGFFVPELNKSYPTHHDVRSWHGHCFEWDAVEPGKYWWQEPYNYRSEDDLKEDERDDMNRNRATRELLLWYLNYMLEISTSEWKDMIIIGQNEWPAGSNFHLKKLLPIYKKHGLAKDRLVTSFLYKDWYQEKAEIFDHFMGSYHGIYYKENYEEAEGIEDVKDVLRPLSCGYSMDGFSWGSIGKNYSRLKDTIKYALKYGLFYELNNDWWGPDVKTDFHAGIVCGEALREKLEEL